MEEVEFSLLKIGVCSFIALGFMSRWSLLELCEPIFVLFYPKSFVLRHHEFFRDLGEGPLAHY